MCKLDSLSTSQQQVADLVARGLSNLAIGEALFISIRTVENHLVNIYSKLELAGIPSMNSRVKLALWVIANNEGNYLEN